MLSSAAPERVSDFALLDYEGGFHQLSRYLHREALVVMSFDAQCESQAQQLSAYLDLAAEWQERNVSFLLLDSYGKGRDIMANADQPLPLLEDVGQLVSETLDIVSSGEVIALDPQRGSLLYRGPVAPELGSTLTTFLDGGVEDTTKLPVSGCAIDYPVRDQHEATPPDYATEVAPVIIDNCLECHRREGVGPFAMDSYIMMMGWSPMIREVLINKRMPPTQVDPYIGHSDAARYLTADELQTVVHWIDAGMPRGDSEEDPLEVATFENRDQWLLGEPDYTVVGPEISVPSVGVMDYIYETVDFPFDEDRWVRAFQYQAGDESVLHHLMAYVVPEDEDFWGPENDTEVVARRFLAGFAPGKIEAVEFPADTGVLIPAGHRLAMQFHYVTNGRSTTDQTSLGIYFHDTPPSKEILTHALGSHFTLPPEVTDFPLTVNHRFDSAVTILGVRAHMHYRGKRMRFSARLPDNTVKEIFSVPAYNYGWQPHYLFSEPVQLPAGSTINVTGALDNSLSNPTNPNPEAEVEFGVYSWEEMFTGYWTYYEND